MPRIIEQPDVPLLEAGYALNPNQRAALLSLPEVAAIAVPGEGIMGFECELHHFLVQFWPEVLQRKPSTYGRVPSKDPVWVMTPPMVYDIDTRAKADHPVSTFENDSHGDHWTRVVKAMMPGHCRTYGMPNAWLCRGDAWFSNDPMQAVMALRHWTVQSHNTSDDRYLSCTCGGGSGRTWWAKHLDEFVAAYPEPKVVLVPGGEPYIPYAAIVEFDVEKVRAMSVGSVHAEGLYTKEGVKRKPVRFVESGSMPQGLPE